MPKRRSNPTTVEELEKEVEDIATEIRDEIGSAAEVETVKETEKRRPDDAATKTEVEKKIGELTTLAEDGSLDKFVAFVRKADRKIIEKLYTEYERKRERKANEFLTDLLISKFAGLLGGLDAVSDPEELTSELGNDELLKRDVYSVVHSITPYLPLLGILSGGITTAKHIAKHKLTEPPSVEVDIKK